MKQDKALALAQEIPPQHAEAIADRIDPQLQDMRADYHSFATSIKAGYDTSRHIELVTSELMRLEAREYERLMLFMPPRHSKTETSVVRFIPWWLGRNPGHRIMYVTYGAHLAQSKSRLARSIIQMPLYRRVFPDVKLRTDSHAVYHWNLQDQDGGVQACGVDGAITGEGADLLILDDLIKNRAEAESPQAREKIWTALLNDVETRCEPRARVLYMTTRYHIDDPAGRFLEVEPDKWHVIKLAAMAEEADPLGRGIGEALWPERWPVNGLIERRRKLGTYSFTSLYQQEPQMPGGNIIKRAWIETYNASVSGNPPGTIRYAGVDTATSMRTAGHDSAICEGARRPDGKILVTGGLSGQYSVIEFADRLLDRQKALSFQGIIFELNNAGEAIKQRVLERGQQRGVYPPIIGVTAKTDKMIRLLPASALIENGQILFNEDDPWVMELIDSLVTFAPGDDMDNVDAFAWMIHGLTSFTAGGADAYSRPRAGNYDL